MKKLLFAILISTTLLAKSQAQNLLAIPDTLSGLNFNLNIYDSSKTFYPGYSTKTFGVNTNYLGPTLFLNQGDSVSMMVTNHLMDTTTIHWHGMHVSAMNDGGPHSFILPGTTWNPRFKVRDQAAMFWYHPHLHMMTNLHASLGAAGLIIVRDSIEKKLNLPRRYGVDDFPLVIQSKCFDGAKQIAINNAYDSTMMVNGTLNAYLPTPAQVIRFRLLNASSERVYNLGLENNLTFYQIGTDGGLLNAPVPLTRLRLAPGERADILIDFTGKLDQTIKLMSYASEFPNAIYGAKQPGMGAGQVLPGYSANILNGANFHIMTFNIVAPTAFPITQIPITLVNNTPWNTASSNASKTLTFSPKNPGPTAIQGPFLINNASYNMDIFNYSIPLNNIETWTLSNQSPIAHPFHIHDIQFYITDINGSAPPPNMMGRKDVVLVQAMQTVTFIAKFETFCDPMAAYMYHCHMLPHEDNGMMGQFVVTCPTGVGLNENMGDFGNINLYPNPSSGTLTIENISGKLITEIRVLDLLGKTISAQNNINTDKASLNLDSAPTGIYLVEIKTISGITIRKINLIK